MAYDPVLGNPTPDLANPGRIKQNAMVAELDSRLVVVEGGYPSHRIFESTEDATSNSTSYMDTNLEFPVISGKLYQFFAMILFSAQVPGQDSPNLPAGYQQTARFSVRGPGTTPSPVPWLHYWVVGYGSDNGVVDWFLSEYDAGESGYEWHPHPSAGEKPDEVAFLRGLVQPPASGAFRFRFAGAFSQDNGIVAHAGSTVEVW